MEAQPRSTRSPLVNARLERGWGSPLQLLSRAEPCTHSRGGSTSMRSAGVQASGLTTHVGGAETLAVSWQLWRTDAAGSFELSA